MRVLLAEDDAALADVIARGLRREALSVDIAPDGGTALERARTVAYDVIVLDRDLPVLHGDAVCEALTEAGALPRILMLTASAAIEERVEGDYRFVVTARREVVAEAVAMMVAAVDYTKHTDSLHIDFGAKPGFILWVNKTGLQVATVRE